MKNISVTSHWLEHLPLTGKNYSGAEACSFLVQKDQFYFMDNHRLALWCWQDFFQKNKSSELQYNFLHIDAHEDAKVDIDNKWWEKIQGISLNQFMKELSPVGNYSLFRWDNYLPVFVHAQQKKIRKSVFVTHDVGHAGFAHQRIKAYNLLQEFPKLFVDELQWIINLDLDYFYAKEYKAFLLYDTAWIKLFFNQLKAQYDKGDIALMTIALSPECCGGWDKAEKVLEIFEEVFNLGVSSYLTVPQLK